MKTSAAILTICLSSVAMAAMANAAELPTWAYPLNPPAPAGAPPPKDDGAPKHVPNSTVALTRTQSRT